LKYRKSGKPLVDFSGFFVYNNPGRINPEKPVKELL